MVSGAAADLQGIQKLQVEIKFALGGKFETRFGEVASEDVCLGAVKLISSCLRKEFRK